MGATKGRDGAAGVDAREQSDALRPVPNDDRARDSDVGVSGVREHGESQRETTPAPPHSDEWATNLPSARPTSVPDFDVAALAFETALRHQPLPSLPLDMAVPTRTRATPPPALELRMAFVLLHVDDRSSVRDIADVTAIAIEEAQAIFVELAQLGLVELAGTRPPPRPVPLSGERKKVDVADAATPEEHALDDARLGPDDETLR